MTGAHLTSEQIAAFASGAISDDERPRIIAHLAECAECRARSDQTEPPTQVGFHTMPKDSIAPRVVDKADRFERGSALGRYLVLDVLGAGGMGVVYAAFDPELDRKVAIKLLQARPSTGEQLSGGQAWLLREAQAMARLSHPNVLAIHDVGTLPGDRVFLAMELVEGQTLRAWLKEKKRPWRETLPVLLQAGAGLAAAHSAGLVHRDFKPDNVLVGGDGRVKVMDFGLARLERGGAPDPGDPATRGSDADLIAQLSPLTADLTQPGRVLGTPAYMAPEVYAGTADAKSDQFAFGVALYEAMTGGPPFTREAMLARGNAPLVPKEPPADVVMPAHVKRVIWRALAAKPADRFPSMDALLAELAIDPGAHRRRALLIAAVALVGVVAVGGTWALSSSKERACRGVGTAKLAGVWDGARKDAVRAAFTGTGRPFAAQADAAVEHALDAYVAEWTQMSTEACEATRVRGEQSEAVLSLRQACLEERRYELEALVSLFVKADAALVDKSDRAAFALDPVKRCENVVALQAPGQPPSDPESKPKLDELQHTLGAAKAALDAARFDAAVKSADDAVTLSRAIHFPSAEAEALLRRGMALNQSGKAADAATALADAVFAAVRGKRDDVASEAASVAAQNAGDALGKDGEARVWLGLADATAARVGVDCNLGLQLLEAKGVVAGARGDLVAAADFHEKALALAVEIHGAGHPALWRSEQLLAASLAKAADYKKAIPHFESALQAKEQAGGPDHPDVALILTSLGACYDHVGDGDKARASLERSLAIREKNFGKDSPKLVATLNNIADLLRQQGKLDEAFADADRGYTIASKVPGPAHPLTHTVATTLAEVLTAQGKIKDARAMLDDVIAREQKAQSPVLGTTLASRAALAVIEKSWADAESFASQAVASVERAGGAESPELCRPLTSLAQAKIGLGHADAARPILERAIAVGTKAQLKPSDLAAAQSALANLR